MDIRPAEAKLSRSGDFPAYIKVVSCQADSLNEIGHCWLQCALAAEAQQNSGSINGGAAPFSGSENAALLGLTAAVAKAQLSLPIVVTEMQLTSLPAAVAETLSNSNGSSEDAVRADSSSKG